jgi:hypothetical protein
MQGTKKGNDALRIQLVPRWLKTTTLAQHGHQNLVRILSSKHQSGL